MIDWKKRLAAMPDATEAQRAERRLVMEFIADRADAPTRDEIIRAYDDLRTARIELHEVSEAELAAREALKAAESAVLLKYAANPKDLGGNEAARSATIRDLTAKELAEVERMRALKGHVQLRADLASMGVQELQWLIRADQAAADVARLVS